MSVQEVYEAAMRLSPEERAQLRRRLYDVAEPAGEDLDFEAYREACAKLIEERVAQADAGDFAEGDWRDTIRRARREGGYE